MNLFLFCVMFFFIKKGHFQLKQLMDGWMDGMGWDGMGWDGMGCMCVCMYVFLNPSVFLGNMNLNKKVKFFLIYCAINQSKNLSAHVLLIL